MGKAYSLHGIRGMHHKEDLDIGGRKILKWILEE
jgi:hypothetical protein